MHHHQPPAPFITRTLNPNHQVHRLPAHDPSQSPILSPITLLKVICRNHNRYRNHPSAIAIINQVTVLHNHYSTSLHPQ
jgi:hypothetical protein